MKRILRIAAVAVLGLSFTASMVAHSATETADFNVTLTILANCQITAEDIDFGTYSVGQTADYSQTGDVVVTCAAGTTPYDVSLSTGGSGNYVTRQMTHSLVLLVNYNLYTEAAHTNVWGDGSGATVTQPSNTIDQVQTFTAYGNVPSGQTVTPGTYIDTITATVTF